MSTPPRLAPLLAQFDFALDRLLKRLDGMDDAEYLWEPVPGCWSIRPRGQQRASSARGGGAWVIETAQPAPDPPPFTTIAWRICHLASGLAMRADYTIGAKALTWDTYQLPGTAAGGIAALTVAGENWRQALTSARDADLDQVGRSSFPYGLDPTLPFLDIAWWVNQETLHHGGEIALLRDLYRVQPR
jgi:hypothetical protein